MEVRTFEILCSGIIFRLHLMWNNETGIEVRQNNTQEAKVGEGDLLHPWKNQVDKNMQQLFRPLS